jgi:hypothetical protein
VNLMLFHKSNLKIVEFTTTYRYPLLRGSHRDDHRPFPAPQPGLNPVFSELM